MGCCVPTFAGPLNVCPGECAGLPEAASTTRLETATVATTTKGFRGRTIYALTVIVGACLLFLIQPLIAKLILPWFGGSSAVWSAALLFFQVCVFAGYAYAHLLTRAPPRMQSIVHAILLIAACALMPIVPSEAWRTLEIGNPTLAILLLLTASVGLPCLLLSATSPLMQVWSMRQTGSEPPFWLYSLSNVGSLLALLGFPMLLEPYFDAHTLAIAWSVLFGAWALIALWPAWIARHSAVVVPTSEHGRRPSVSHMALWLLFPACASGLLVSVTAHLSTNVAPIPLLWVVPLSLYLLTFILNFGNRRFYNRANFFPWVAAALGCMTYLYMKGDANLHLQYAIPLYLASLFVICMACHGELITREPTSKYLTHFYLLIALGGALGGAFVALIAPLVFESHWEFPILLIATAELLVIVQWRRRGPVIMRLIVRGAMVIGVVALALFLMLTEVKFRDGYLAVERNFYGVLRVRDDDVGYDVERRSLLHGTISHGYQFANDEIRELAGSYYSTHSGVGRTLLASQAYGPLRVGIIGLGVGVLVSYAREGDLYTVYELNPAVVRMSGEHFDFVPRARNRGAILNIVLGDARLSLENQPSQQFDVLALDAFSSDAIPTHLLTHEAMELYFRHLKPDGVLAVHISNRYLDLVPVCQRAAEHVGRAAVVIEEPSDAMAHASSWVLITSNIDLLREAPFKGAQLAAATAPPDFRGWTDRYSNIWTVLKFWRPESTPLSAEVDSTQQE